MSDTPVEADQIDEIDGDDVPVDETPLDEPLGDPVLSGDPQIDQALVRLDELDGREIAEHPQAYEDIHRVLRDSLSGLGRPAGS